MDRSKDRPDPVAAPGGPARIGRDKCRLSLSSLVIQPIEFTWQEFLDHPRDGRPRLLIQTHCEASTEERYAL